MKSGITLIWIMTLVALLCILPTINLVSAENVQPTQQYNKIFLNPFYRASLNSATNYTYNVTINPPDKISNIINAIISFNVQINGQSQALSLWINGKQCNTPIYSVATAFSTTGQVQMYFDCSNQIKSAGNYTITINSAVNTGTISGWVDLTYMNNPNGGLSLSGTEYSPNDPATIFVQLKDNYGNAVQNGSCYLDIWYPANASNIHPYTIQDSPMLVALGDDGIYYYDLVAPSILGIYMLSAKCSYSYDWKWYYSSNEVLYYPIAQYGTGTWSGGTSQVLNSNFDSLYEKCTATLANPCASNYTFNTSVYGLIENVTNINIYYSGEDDTSGKTLTMAYWNGTGFKDLTNILTFSGTATTVPTGYEEYLTNSIPLNGLINNSIKIRLTTTGTSKVWNNWLSLALLSSSGTIQDVKGSSEMHITNKANVTVTATVNNTDIANSVWTAADRNLTFYPAQVDMTNYTMVSDTVWAAINRSLTFYPDTTNYTLITETVINSINYTLIANNIWQWNGVIIQSILDQIGSSTSQYVWNATDRNLTFYPAQVDLTNYTQIAEDTSNAVWNAANRNLTYYPSPEAVNYTIIANTVWNAATRNLTFYPTQIDLTNYTQIVDMIWTSAIRNLTFYPEQIDLTNYNEIANVVWNATTRNLTFYEIAAIDYKQIAQNVWNATDRNLTFYPVQIDMTNYTNIADVIWNAASRNLTFYPDMTDYNKVIIGVWNATDRNLTFYPAQVDLTNYSQIINNVINGVWNATDRNLTFYPTAIDTTNYTMITDYVWNAGNRNLTYTEDVVDYNKIIVGVWNATDRNLTFYPVQIDMTNYTLIGEMVANSSINYTLIADNVWQWNGVILQNILNQISSTTAQNVWNTSDRNLTFYPAQVDLTNYTLIQESVWQNLNRTLTDFNFTVNVNVNETAIADAVWQSVDRTLTDFNFTVNATVEANNTAIADAVWSAVNRTLTDYNQTDVTDYNKIQQMVWNATDRNLTYYQNFGDQTNYTLMADVVWNATQRTLTELNLTVDVNNTAIANAVWASVNRSLTYYNQSDLTDYNLIQTMVWNATIRTLTDFNISVNATVDTSGIAGAVWNYSNRTVQSSGSTGSVGSVDNVSVVESIKNLGVTFIGGTEYNAGDDGKIAIRLIRGTGDLAEIENGADCKVSIVKPDNSLLIDNASMTPLSPGTQGVYTYDFNVPSTLGIYPYYTNCNVSTRNYYSLNSFHVYAGNNLTAQDVWAAPTRDLTYYPTTNISLTNESIQELGNAVWSYNGTISPNILTQLSNAISCTFQNLQSDLNLKWGVQLNSC